MNLVFFTYEIDSNSKVLAFAIDWINELSKYVNHIDVIALNVGLHKVSKNITIHNVNQKGKNKLQTVFSIWKLLYKISKTKKTDGYFVHMAHYFVPFIYLFAKIYNQKIVMWKSHKATPVTLKLADKLVDRVLASTNLGYRIKNSKKLKVIGQGIDTNKFYLKSEFNDYIKNFAIVGRISPSKNVDLIVKHFIEVLKVKKDVKLYIVGDIINKDEKLYLDSIKYNIQNSNCKDSIIFTGQVSREYLPKFYESIDMVINIGDTGSLDKVIVEPMSMGIPVITSNDSAKDIFQHLNNKGIYFTTKDSLSKDILYCISTKNDIEYNMLRDEIIQNHSITNLVRSIINEF